MISGFFWSIMYTFVIVHGTQENSELYLSFVLDGWIIIRSSGLYLRKVPSRVKSYASSFSPKGVVVKKLSTVMFWPIKKQGCVNLLFCNCEFNNLLY